MHRDINVAVGGPINANYPKVYVTKFLKPTIPFALQVTEQNTKYVIKHNFDLGGEEITIPENCILEFDGGSLNNGTVIGRNTGIAAGLVKIFDTDITLAGTWNVKEGYPQWFGIVPDNDSLDLAPILLKLLVFGAVIRLKRGIWYMSECHIYGRWHVLIEGENMGYDEETEIRPFKTGQHYILKLGGTTDFADVPYSDEVNVRRFRINGIRFYVPEGYELTEAVDGTPSSGALCMQYCVEGYVNVSFLVNNSRALFISSSWEILFDYVKVYGAYNQTNLPAIYFGKKASDNYSNISAITFNYLCGENVSSSLIDCAVESIICPLIINTLEYEDWSAGNLPPRSLVTNDIPTIIAGIRETEKSYLINVSGWVSFGTIQITSNGAKKYTNILDGDGKEYVRGVIKINPGETSKIHANQIKMVDCPYFCIGNYGTLGSQLSIDQVFASGYADNLNQYGRVYIDSNDVLYSEVFGNPTALTQKSSVVNILKCDTVINPDLIKVYDHLRIDGNNFNEIVPIVIGNWNIVPIMYKEDNGLVAESLQLRSPNGEPFELPRKFKINGNTHLKFVTGINSQSNANHICVLYYKNDSVVNTDYIKFDGTQNESTYYYTIWNKEYDYFTLKRVGSFVLISIEALNLNNNNKVVFFGSDINTDVINIMGHYCKDDAYKRTALQCFFNTIGSIKNKLNHMLLPIFANNINEAIYDVIANRQFTNLNGTNYLVFNKQTRRVRMSINVEPENWQDGSYAMYDSEEGFEGAVTILSATDDLGLAPSVNIYLYSNSTVMLNNASQSYFRPFTNDNIKIIGGGIVKDGEDRYIMRLADNDKGDKLTPVSALEGTWDRRTQIFGRLSEDNTRGVRILVSTDQLITADEAKILRDAVIELDNKFAVLDEVNDNFTPALESSIIPKSGTFANRPTIADYVIPVGFAYFCTDKQTEEGAADGITIYYKGQDTTDPDNPVDVWVDALGRVVSDDNDNDNDNV